MTEYTFLTAVNHFDYLN